MKRLAASALLLGMLGLLGMSASALALPITFEVAGSLDPALRATVTASYDPSSAVATFTILNTTTSQGAITGFAFNLPGDGQGITGVSDQSGYAKWHLLDDSDFAPNSINTAQSLGSYDVGLGTGPNFNGGKPNYGIAIGASMTFSLLFSGEGASVLSTGAILAALSQPKGSDLSQYFAVRFQETTGGKSDVAIPASPAAPTPLPGGVWLLGSALLGIFALRKLRAAN